MTKPSIEGDTAGNDTKGPAPQSSYFQILRSTAMFGGSSVIAIVFSIVRNKAAAVLIGPEGIGLMGLYTVLLDLVQGIACLGIQSSGVRQIAEASEDARRRAVVASVLRKSSLLLGIAGMAVMFVLAVPISRITVGEHADTTGMTLLSLAILLRVLAGAELTLLQGMREIAVLARVTVMTAFLGTLATIPMLYFLGTEGVVPSLVTVSAISLAVSMFHARRIRLPAVRLKLREVRNESAALLQLGIVFLASSLLTAGVAYGVRLLVLQYSGAVAAGLYQAAWTLGGFYAGFVLQAMGADFYPRLTAVCNDHVTCNRLVNEQAQIGMLLAGPGLLATLSVAPIVISWFYTPQFQEAGTALRWICLGMMLRTVAWPMGFIVVAKGIRSTFLVIEVLAAATHLGLAWWLIPRFGSAGAGAAFFGLYVCYGIMMYFVVRHLTGFRWSFANLKLGLLLISSAAAVLGLFSVTSFWQATAIGTAITTAVSLYCLHVLLKLMPPEALPAPIRSRLLKLA